MAYADKFPTSMKKGGMKNKNLPKAQLGKMIGKAVDAAKRYKAKVSEALWPTGHLRRGEDWDNYYRQKSSDKIKGAVTAGGIAAGTAAAVANKKDKPKQKSVPKKRKGGFPDLTGDGKVTRADVLKGRGVFKKGGSIMKTAGKTTTGVISDYKGYKGPKSKTPMTKLKKSK